MQSHLRATNRATPGQQLANTTHAAQQNRFK